MGSERDVGVHLEFDTDVVDALVYTMGRWMGLDTEQLRESPGLRTLVSRNIQWFRDSPDWMKLVGLVLAKKLNHSLDCPKRSASDTQRMLLDRMMALHANADSTALVPTGMETEGSIVPSTEGDPETVPITGDTDPSVLVDPTAPLPVPIEAPVATDSKVRGKRESKQKTGVTKGMRTTSKRTRDLVSSDAPVTATKRIKTTPPKPRVPSTKGTPPSRSSRSNPGTVAQPKSERHRTHSVGGTAHRSPPPSSKKTINTTRPSTPGRRSSIPKPSVKLNRKRTRDANPLETPVLAPVGESVLPPPVSLDAEEAGMSNVDPLCAPPSLSILLASVKDSGADVSVSEDTVPMYE